jgi:hypothetical protein
MPPLHDTPILGMVARPRVQVPTEYGSDATPQGFWTEWPSGLVDVSRTSHIPPVSGDSQVEPPPLTSALLDIPVHGDRIVRVKKNCTALVIIDMQKLIHSSSLFLFQALTAGIQKFLSPSGIERPFNRSEMRRTVNEGCPCASRRRNQDPLGVGHNLCLTRIRAYLIGVAEIGG